MPSITAGVYTEEQAAACTRLYAQRCVMCHGALLVGTYETPGPKDKFIANRDACRSETFTTTSATRCHSSLRVR